MSRLSLLAVVALVAGCFDTSASVPFGSADASSADTMVDSRDGSTTDTTGDMTPLYPRDTLPRGVTCPGVPTEPPLYSCSPVLQDCDRDERCEIQILGTGFAANCRRRGANETFDIADGEPCDVGSETQRCRLGARCIVDVCRALCEFEDAVGCPADERCESIDDGPGPNGDILEGYGICVASCR